jgi:AcrR family transcriptional regulator
MSPPVAATDVARVEADFLDAAERCLHRSGIRRTTMVQVADEAGLSRAWLYRHFPDKAALLGAALVRQDEQFWADARSRISRRTTLVAQVAEAVRYSREQRASALVLRLRATEPEACAALLGAGLRQAMPGMAMFWRPFLEAARERGEVRAGLPVAAAAEWVMRIVLSLVTVPGDAVDVDDAASVRRFLRQFLVAGLVDSRNGS